MRLILAFSVLISVTLTGLAQAQICLQGSRIDRTERPDDTMIVFYMRDRTVFRAHVQGRCVGLANDTRGFSYEPNPGTDEICSNLWTIRLNSTGAICLMGAFEKISK